jgi:hypothetical protein
MGVLSSFSWIDRASRAIGILAIGAVCVPLACSDDPPQVVQADGGAASDAGALGATADLSECTPQPDPFTRGKNIISSLESYCAARERAGQSSCPKTRRDVLSRMNELCGGRTSIFLSSACSADVITVSDLDDSAESVTWYFSSSTGELIGAYARMTSSMGCGEAVVHAGLSHSDVIHDPCNPVREIPYDCHAPCFAPSAKCPADILAELPPTPSCGAPPPITHEVCAVDEAPHIGGDPTCGASQCSAFSFGTCGGTCECHRRGRYEWNSWCTE